MNLRLRQSGGGQSTISDEGAEQPVPDTKDHDSLIGEEVNGSRFPPISPLGKSNPRSSRKSARSNLIHRIRFSSKDGRHSDSSTSRPLSPASSCYSRRSLNTTTSHGSSSMMQSVKRALKPRKNRKSNEEESQGLLVEGEHEIAPMLMHSFGTLDFSNNKEVDVDVDDDILVDVDEAIANPNRERNVRSMSPVSVATEKSPSASQISGGSQSTHSISKKPSKSSSASVTSPKRRWKRISLSPSKKRPSPPKAEQCSTPCKPPLSNGHIYRTPAKRSPPKPKDGFCRQVDSYDGQIIIVDNQPTYELGNYLGGGVAGVVYEGTRLRPEEEYPIRKSATPQTPKPILREDDIAIEVPTMLNQYVADIPMVDSIDAPSRSKYMRTSSFDPRATMEETVAVKILNPIGFRLLPPGTVQTALVVKQGLLLSPEVKHNRTPMQPKHVWWLINPNSRNLRTLMLKKSPDSPSPAQSTDSVDRGRPDRGVRLSLIAAYPDFETNELKELPLQKCIEIWGHAPFGASEQDFEDMMDVIERVNSGQLVDDTSHSDTFYNTGLGKAASSGRNVIFNTKVNAYIAIPAVPPKFLRWLRQRRAATKEIRNMMHIGRHKNVVHLYEVLELIENSKSTMFLILELVRGGELFDLISSTSTSANNLKITNKADAEPIMRKFFYELASGIAYCHSNGIAHRDLKPENLLVHHDDNECVLKIADFGLSATFAVMNHQESSITESSTNENMMVQTLEPVTGLSPLFKHSFSQIGATALNLLSCGTHSAHCAVPCPDNHDNAPVISQYNHPQPLRRMTSIVGSPHYVAPEIVLQAEQKHRSKTLGYDGAKADTWSAGVILYAMLYRSLPFGEDLLRCPRYQSFVKWYDIARQMKGSRRSSQTLSLSDDFVDTKCLGPHWFFPVETSVESRDFIMAMLNPDPVQRFSIAQCLIHPWLRGHSHS